MHCKITRRNGNFILNDLGNEIGLESIKASINDETSQKHGTLNIIIDIFSRHVNSLSLILIYLNLSSNNIKASPPMAIPLLSYTSSISKENLSY